MANETVKNLVCQKGPAAGAHLKDYKGQETTFEGAVFQMITEGRPTIAYYVEDDEGNHPGNERPSEDILFNKDRTEIVAW